MRVSRRHRAAAALARPQRRPEPTRGPRPRPGAGALTVLLVSILLGAAGPWPGAAVWAQVSNKQVSGKQAPGKQLPGRGGLDKQALRPPVSATVTFAPPKGTPREDPAREDPVREDPVREEPARGTSADGEAARAGTDTASGPALNATGEPYQLVRTLQAIQDRTAHGSREALALQSPLLAQIEQQMMAAAVAAWQEPRNARAAIIFALSGGSPSILRKLSRLDPAPAVEPEILRGVLAYVEGRADEARRHLAQVDARALAPGLDGRIALVQSALHASSDPQRALHLLDLSRLMLPGTLVDEGALRRAVFLAGQLGLTDRFRTLSRHYLLRYPRSVYAADFHQRFSSALVRLNLSGTAEEERWLAEVLNALDIPARVNVNLILAKQALSHGKRRMAVLGAEHALALAPPGSVVRERARLYAAAATVVDEQSFTKDLATLRAIDRARLPADDAALLDSALYLATRIRELPVAKATASRAGPPPATAPTVTPATVPAAAPAGDLPSAAPRGAEIPALDATISRVRQLIGDSDKLINEETGS